MKRTTIPAGDNITVIAIKGYHNITVSVPELGVSMCAMHARLDEALAEPLSEDETEIFIGLVITALSADVDDEVSAARNAMGAITPYDASHVRDGRLLNYYLVGVTDTSEWVTYPEAAGIFNPVRDLNSEDYHSLVADANIRDPDSAWVLSPHTLH